MFQIGDVVVYPMYGAGVIESIEEKKVLKERHSYYIMKMPICDMMIMIPVDKSEEIGVRYIIDEHTANDVVKHFSMPVGDVIENWNKRYRNNLERIRTGNVFEVLEVVKSLLLRDRLKGLSTGERKMMNNAKQILISELVLALHISGDEIENMLLKSVDENKEEAL